MGESDTGPRRVHLPWGYLPVGQRVRAVCSCGFGTSPRVDERRALDSLLSEHGVDSPVCWLCGTDHHGHSWEELRTSHLDVLTDPATGDQFLACRGMPRACRDGAAQQQLHLDQAAADQLGIDIPRPKVRLITDGVAVQHGQAPAITTVATLPHDPAGDTSGDPVSEVAVLARQFLVAAHRYLDRCTLADNTITAYRRQTTTYLAWLTEHAADHEDAFADVVGAEAAVTAWREHLLRRQKASPATVNQALAAVTLLYEHGPQLRIAVKRARVPRPGEPDALEPAQHGTVEQASVRRGERDAAIVAVLLYAGARVEECQRLDLDDVAITARTGSIRLRGKDDEVRNVPLPAVARERISAWITMRGNHPGPLWIGQRGRLTISGITQVVLAVGQDAGLPDLRPRRLRHTYATRLRQGGADITQVRALLGHASVETSARYFRAETAETAAAVVDTVFEQ